VGRCPGRQRSQRRRRSDGSCPGAKAELLHKPSGTAALLSSHAGETKSCSRSAYLPEQHFHPHLLRPPRSRPLPTTSPALAGAEREQHPLRWVPSQLQPRGPRGRASPGPSGRRRHRARWDAGWSTSPAAAGWAHPSEGDPIPPVSCLHSLLFPACLISTALGARLFQQLLVCKSH